MHTVKKHIINYYKINIIKIMISNGAFFFFLFMLMLTSPQGDVIYFKVRRYAI